MKSFWTGPLALLAAAIIAAPALAQAPARPLVIPGQAVATPIPGAHEMPNPATDYKVVFVVGKATPKPGDVSPELKAVSRFVNTLAANGVPLEHRHVAVVIHDAATDMIMQNDAYKAAHEGRDNPDIALLRAMKAAGVELYVCGQAVLGHKIDPKTIQPEIELTLWAATTVANLELRGYVPLGG
jgi:intracellular sulfur oxidation DsrE/DsrF family protein